MSYWVISSESLMEMLQRVAAGESPDLVYIEFYCNCEHEYQAEEGTDAAQEA